MANGNGILNIQGRLGVVQHVHQGDQEFPAGDLASEADAGEAFFQAGFQVSQAIEATQVGSQSHSQLLE